MSIWNFMLSWVEDESFYNLGAWFWCHATKMRRSVIVVAPIFIDSITNAGKAQTSLLSYRDQLELWILSSSKFNYYTSQSPNNKDAEQTARICSPISALIFLFTCNKITWLILDL